jgi:hypothetical protein
MAPSAMGGGGLPDFKSQDIDLQATACITLATAGSGGWQNWGGKDE